MKPGDTVRYLNATGGGVITRIEGQLAYVEEDGFETPVQTKELVVVMPAGYKPQSNARLMFDQAAYNAGSAGTGAGTACEKPADGAGTACEKPAAERPAERRRDGKPVTEGSFRLSLVFEPTDAKALSRSRFTALLVNDSPYTVAFMAAARSADNRLWHLLEQEVIAKEEMIEIGVFSHEQLPDIEHIAIQATGFAPDADFALCPVVAANRRLDITKFHKLHCFRPAPGFDTPVLEFQLTGNGGTGGTAAEETADAAGTAAERTLNAADLEALRRNFAAGTAAGTAGEKTKKRKGNDGKPSPYKLLPPVEVDLHIHELTDTTAGMQPADMLALQLETVRRTMAEHRRRIGQKIIFIHGKGEGVLRQAVLKLLRREYPAAELQDASFREYGFGATLVTIRQK